MGHSRERKRNLIEVPGGGAMEALGGKFNNVECKFRHLLY